MCERCNDTGIIISPAIIAPGYYEPEGEDICPDCNPDDIPF